MRSVVLYTLLSLDGVAEEPGDWFVDDGPEVVANLARVIATQDTVLLGHGTYDYWSGYWPTADVEPFAGFVNGTPKHVFTSTTPDEPWANTTFVAAPAAEHVAELKQQAGGDIGIHGSIALARSLMAARLVDRIELVISPALAGHGRRLFPDDDTFRPVELVTSNPSPKGTLFLTYHCTPAA